MIKKNIKEKCNACSISTRISIYGGKHMQYDFTSL